MITVVLNCYKRPEYLQEQIKALRSQTVKPDAIWLWVNSTDENKGYDFESLGLDKVFISDTNCKYHARFAIGLLARTEYVAFFDDDTIPGTQWFENCVDTMKTHPGIMGGVGIVIHNKNYMTRTRIGWPSNNEEPVEVDLVGHAWFMKREHLNYLWHEVPYTLENGEDIQLSYLAQKYGGVKTYVPPHPKDKPELNSSLKAWEYGNDSKASSNGSLMPVPLFYMQRQDCVLHCLRNGWKLVDNG